MLDWSRGWSQSAMGICAFCYIWNWCGVEVFQTSMFNRRRGWGQSAMSICTFCYIWNLFGAAVFQRPILYWRRGWGHSAMGICASCYIWNISTVVVLHRSTVDWRKGVESVCHGYMCILLYIKPIQWSGFPDIFAPLEEEGGVSLPWVYVHSAICETYSV